MRTVTFKLKLQLKLQNIYCIALRLIFILSFEVSMLINSVLLAAAAAGAGLILLSAAISKSDYFTIIAQYRNIGKKFCYFC